MAGLRARRQEVQRVELRELIREVLVKRVVLLVGGRRLLDILPETCPQDGIWAHRKRCSDAWLENIVYVNV